MLAYALDPRCSALMWKGVILLPLFRRGLDLHKLMSSSGGPVSCGVAEWWSSVYAGTHLREMKRSKKVCTVHNRHVSHCACNG